MINLTIISTTLLLLLSSTTQAFVTLSTTSISEAAPAITLKPKLLLLNAGGFEWEDPQDSFDQGVENPYKNPSLMDGENGLKVDPARLLEPRLSGTNLYFIGMMGSGKTAVGSALAKRMGSYNFLDTDQIIEQCTKMKIPEIFEKEGEPAFREIEGQVLDSVHAYVRCVVSTGGGIAERMENWSKLQSGIVVWLDVKSNVIMQRLENGKSGVKNRPLLQTDNPKQTLEDLLEKRKGKYGQADITIIVDTYETSADSVADMVIREIHDFIDDNPPAWKAAKVKAQTEGLDWVQ